MISFVCMFLLAETYQTSIDEDVPAGGRRTVEAEPGT